MEVIAAEAQIRSLLVNGGMLPTGTPVEPAPYDADGTYPAVIYRCMTPNPDTIEVGGSVVFSTLDYLVTVTAPGSNAYSLIHIVAAIDNSLRNKGGVNSYGTVNTITRVRPYSAPYQSKAGNIMQNIGYVYRVRVQGNYNQ